MSRDNDITAPDIVEVKLREDKKVLWVNVYGICVLRICRIKDLMLDGLEVKRAENVKTEVNFRQK